MNYEQQQAALDEFMVRMHDVKRMTELVEQHTQHAIHPDEVTWCDVADLGRVQAALSDLCEPWRS